MKFLHTADLHIGKKLFEHSLLEDQKYILDQILEIAVREKVDALLIAGDVYDRAVPQAEAVELLDDFLTRLIRVGIPVLMISGNHDSPERVSFAEDILEKQGLYIAGTCKDQLKQVVIGDVAFVLLPFVKPAVTGNSTLKDSVESLLGNCPMALSENRQYVLVTHYFVTGAYGETPVLSDSETDVNVGGLDSVPSSLFGSFAYTALGHIHTPQQVGGEAIYYAGAPLKYSFGEARQVKSVNLVELSRDEIKVEKIALKPLHELRCLKGRLEDLLSKEVLEDSGEKEDYLQITLTDKEELMDPMSTLRSVYPNVLQLLFEKNQLGAGLEYEMDLLNVQKGTEELFAEFYELIRGEPMDEKRREFVRIAAEKAKDRS